ncbi:MAG: VWA domain-containing protein, partial [Colwellia sp.]
MNTNNMMTSFDLFLTHFHFVRPLWLLTLFALAFVLWLLQKQRFHQSPWNKFLPVHLSKALVEGSKTTYSSTTGIKTTLLKPFFIGLLSIIALAGPAWQKLPQPVYQTERGSVLIMDMSYSMYATDIKPNRLTRARFKAIDLLSKINEGDIGLIAYSADAFVISPLTQDIKNIELLLPSLTPEIMPEPGANPYAALVLAHEMLLNAGHLNGDIYWFTDDVNTEELTDIYDWSEAFGHQLNILGVGTANGAPIKLSSGKLLKDSYGAIVIPRLPSQKLNSLASKGNGHYKTITNDDSDIDFLILQGKLLALNSKTKNKKQGQQTGDQWQEQGAWLLVLVLPLVLSYFRRGGAILMLPFTSLPLLFSLLFSLSFTLVSSPTFANDKKLQQQETTLQGTLQQNWQNLWQTKDQQAQQQYNQESYQAAAQQFNNMQWQGSAHYKAGDYQAALDSFKQGEHATSANSLYNQGNALAQLQQYDKAIEAYEKALQKNPDVQDAKDNIEKIKQQQKEQQEQKQDQQQGDQPQGGESQKDRSQEGQSQEKKSKNPQGQNDQEEHQSDSNKQNDSNAEPQTKDEVAKQSEENKKNENEQQKKQ